ncbi:MAG TPA: DUF6148 family protein [Xanthobacteraceae bacterium]
MSAGVTLAEAQAQLAFWLAESLKLSSQSYETSTGDMSRRLTRADAAEVRENIKFWDAKVKELTSAESGGRRRIRYPVMG